MPDIRIQRDHTLGLAEARKVAFRWAEQAEEQFDMACTYEEGDSSDEVTFTRSGVNGTLLVTASAFDMVVRLGFLLGAFKDRIEGEIVKNLDSLLAEKATAKTAVKKAATPPAAKGTAKKKA